MVLVAGGLWTPPAAADRIDDARTRMGSSLASMFEDQGVSYPPRVLLLRAFKHEGELELWAGDSDQKPLTKIKTYAVCASSGDLGPKRKRGDLQVPEGFYVVDRYNKWSSYHLSLGIDYPNRADRIAGRKLHAASLGGDIFVHGDCVTIGCIPIEDNNIEEVFVTAWDTKHQHRGKTHVHIFPARMGDAGLATLKDKRPDLVAHFGLWDQLKVGHDLFEKDRRLFRLVVDKHGAYRVSPR